MIVQGGKSVYGAEIGILMLEAQFPRIPGDLGNAQSFDFPVQYRVVRGASPDRVVRKDPSALLPDFIAAGRDLVACGVDGITTNCGFLALFQDALTEALDVPVASSSLMQVAMVNATLPPGKRCGILTISGSTLTRAHLRAANVPEGTPIGSTEYGQEFTRAILDNALTLDVAAAKTDNVEAAVALARAHPEIGALVLECTNMSPYAPAIRAATGLPTFSMLSFITWFRSSLAPRGFK